MNTILDQIDDPILKKLLTIYENKSTKILPKIMNLEEYFHTIKNPVIINQIQHQEKCFEKIIESICDVKSDNIVSSCECGKLEGDYYLDTICPECGTKVKSNFAVNLQNEVWIVMPGDYKVLHPIIFLIFHNCFRKGMKSDPEQNYIIDILDRSKELPPDFAGYITDQGFSYFYENFDHIMNFFINIYPKTSQRAFVKMLPILLERYKDAIWTNKLPIVSKYLQPISKDGYSLRYISPTIKPILKSLTSLVNKDLAMLVLKKSKANIDRFIWKIYYNIIKYYYDIIDVKLKPKVGYFRKNIFGTKKHFTTRSVAVPILDPHYGNEVRFPCFGDEIHFPWAAGLTNYKYHLINILTKRMGYRLYDAYDKIIKGYYRYDPVIDQIFQLLILECKYKGFPVLVNRNPSLLLSNVSLAFVVKIKPHLCKISKTFIQNFGNPKFIKPITNRFLNDKRNLYSKQMTILEESNGFDTPETIRNADVIDIEEHFPKANYLIQDQSISDSYLCLGLRNEDYDGDSINYDAGLFENKIVDLLIERIHPCNFLLVNTDTTITSKIGIPNQHLVILNEWLNDD